MPMTQRPTALRVSLAVLALAATLALGVRLGLQLGALNAANGDLADAQRNAADLQRTARQGVGPPLFEASSADAADVLGQRLQALGLAVRKTDVAAATPAGRDLVLTRFVVEGRGDPAAVDRLALWAEANARSAILEQLTANAGDDGKSDLKIELDALVRSPPFAKAPAS
ncbi:MAG TPA: hypothetical protein VN694_08950 [Caulobacteraceae bacterium]|nr:hypothetical protein [Caulobacteraceae bacterium]